VFTDLMLFHEQRKISVIVSYTKSLVVCVVETEIVICISQGNTLLNIFFPIVLNWR
jgi:hypothetical protein